MEQDIFDQRMLPCDRYQIQQISQCNFFYEHSQYCLRANYLFIEDQMAEDVMSNRKQAELQERRMVVADRIEKWVEENACSQEAPLSRFRVFIVDPELRIYQERDQCLWEGISSFMVQTHLANPTEEIAHYWPDLICYQMGKLGPLRDIVGAVKKINAHPFIVVFGGDINSSRELQKELNYQLLIAVKKDIEFQLVVGLFNKFQEYANKRQKDLAEKKFFLQESNEHSRAFYQHHIVVKKINELEMIFESPHPIPPYTVLEVMGPIHYFVTILPGEGPPPPWPDSRYRRRGQASVAPEH